MTGTIHHPSINRRPSTKMLLAPLLLALCTGCSGVDTAPSSLFAKGTRSPSKESWTDTLRHPIESMTDATGAMSTSLKNTAQSFMGDGKKVTIPTAELARKSPKERRKQGQNLSLAVARTLERQGKMQQAIDAYQQVINSGAKDPDAYHRLAVLYDKTGKFKKANLMYRDAIALSPNNSEILADQGYSFYLQRRYAEAEGTLKQSLKINGDSQRTRNNLAMVLARSEKYDASFSQFRRSGADITEAHVNLAYVMMWKGDLQAAQEEFELALTIDQSCVEAKKGLDRLQALASRPADTKQASAKQISTKQVRGAYEPVTEVAYSSEWPRKTAY